MSVLLAIALKSLLIAGLALGLLALLKNRSAAERSWVAHIGLFALVLLAIAPLALPSWTLEAPALLGQMPAAEGVTALPPSATTENPTLASTAAAATPNSGISMSPTAIATALYALPAAILLFITLLALGRLLTLRARADVLVDGHWLSALARAQRRMGFKHGTALLTSDDLASPISWGLMRPVILLNSRAVEAAGEAEAIISHELAHVARLDWAKLLLARVATALFWFNPLVWILAREAHQLREEAADDSVLAADIADTDYAQLLVGVARHECSGLLLGAHGVAPSKSSLARRVARVLDAGSARGPVARSFALGVFAGALLVAAPLAALTLTPGGSSEQGKAAAARANSEPGSSYYPDSDSPRDLPSIIAEGVSASVETAMAAVSPQEAQIAKQAHDPAILEAIRTADQARTIALAEARQATDRARQIARARHIDEDDIDQIIAIKSTGVTLEYVKAMRAAAPELADLDAAEFAGLKNVGVTPEFARDMVAAGLREVGPEELTSARAVGVTGPYVRGMAAAGVRTSMDNYIQLYAVGVRPEYVTSLRKAGYVFKSVDQLVQMRALGVGPEDLRAVPPTPRPPRVPDPPEEPDADDG